MPGSQAEIAAKVGGPRSAVGFWRRGEKTPNPAARGRLRDAYGIDPRAWDHAPSSPASPRAETSAPPAPAPPPARTEPSSTLGAVEEQLAMLRTLQGNESLLAAEKARLVDGIAKLLAIKARLERDNEMLEDRVVRAHPFWARVKAAILGALRGHPDAARDVAQALAEVEGT